jgi:elongation factor P--(R)-beta-lysine ligase
MTKIKYLRRRGALLSLIRQYFEFQNVLEVHTPVLNEYSTAEASIENFVVKDNGKFRYLRTSPESSLKGLLASGIGDIFEIGPVFRREEESPIHLSEFTILEWYRVGYDHKQLMADVELLLRGCGAEFKFIRKSFLELFLNHVGLNPHLSSNLELSQAVTKFGLKVNVNEEKDRNYLLTCLYVLGVEPNLKSYGAIFLTEFPEELRAYARLSHDDYRSAERFELIINGVELANGYHEVIDPEEQKHCFEIENQTRVQRGLLPAVLDENWISALESGMPPCSGVALGIERLQMALENKNSIYSE